MLSSTSLHDDLASQARDLRQYLTWLFVAVIIGASIEFGVAFALNVPLLNWAGAISLGASALILVARQLTRSGRAELAVLVLGLSLFAVAITVNALIPELLAVLSVAPIVLVALALPYVSERVLTALAVGALLTTLAIATVGSLVPPSSPLPPSVRSGITIVLLPIVSGVVLLLLRQFRRRLGSSLAQLRSTHAALRASESGLAEQVAERTAALEAALADLQAHSAEQAQLVAELTQQRELVRELSVPIMPVTQDTLVMPLVGAMDTARLQLLQDRALQMVTSVGARRLLIDITGVPIVDSQVALGLISVVRAARLLGADVVLVGIRPEVAQALVGLGLSLGVPTFRDLQSALARGQRAPGG